VVKSNSVAGLTKKPHIVVSKCLGFAACRYDGGMKRCPLIEKLRGKAIFKPVCPETAIGLGIPRGRIRLVRRGEKIRLVQEATGKDITGRMTRFSRSFLRSLKNIDGFILKSKSPSCGIGDVKIYDSVRAKRPVSRKGTGIFAAVILQSKEYHRMITEISKEITVIKRNRCNLFHKSL